MKALPLLEKKREREEEIKESRDGKGERKL